MPGRLAVAGAVFYVAALTSPGLALGAEVGLNVYGDLDYSVQERGVVSNSFSAPRIELFPTASENKLSFLAEIMFEVGDDNEFGVDIERVQVSYLFSDWLRVSAGRFHTAIGYYNDVYHHGRYFQMTVDRPYMVRFEDEGGLIPAHSVGLHADGRFQLGLAGALRYDVDLSNGAGLTPEVVTNLNDPNNAKLVNLRLRFEPAFLDGLLVGGNVLYDGITAAATAYPPGPATWVREIMLGAHVAYFEHNVHLIAEYLWVSHRFDGITAATNALFVELGYEFGRFTPYVRGEKVWFPAAIDPFYANNATYLAYGSLTSGILGLRVLASEHIALKVEGEYDQVTVGDPLKMASVQCAYAF